MSKYFKNIKFRGYSKIILKDRSNIHYKSKVKRHNKKRRFLNLCWLIKQKQFKSKRKAKRHFRRKRGEIKKRRDPRIKFNRKKLKGYWFRTKTKLKIKQKPQIKEPKISQVQAKLSKPFKLKHQTKPKTRFKFHVNKNIKFAIKPKNRKAPHDDLFWNPILKQDTRVTEILNRITKKNLRNQA